MADHYVPVPGGTNNNNYANVELIVDIALRTQVQVLLVFCGCSLEIACTQYSCTPGLSKYQPFDDFLSFGYRPSGQDGDTHRKIPNSQNSFTRTTFHSSVLLRKRCGPQVTKQLRVLSPRLLISLLSHGQGQVSSYYTPHLLKDRIWLLYILRM